MWTIAGLFFFVHVNVVFGATKPTFDDQIVNVTANEMETAILPCSVVNLGTHQIVWTDQFSTLLTFEDRRIIDDERLSIERPYHRDWNLHIRDVRYSDQGLYNCQINTEPIRIKMVNLSVKVPSKISESMSTRNVTIKEGEQVTLVCNATGVPQPVVTWYRLVKNDKGEDKQRVGIDGEVLVIHNVTRHCGGNYECVAYNGVSPAATRIIDVSVKFPPEVELPNRRIGQKPGRDTILECTIMAHPMSDVWWVRNGEKISSQDLKYRVEIYDETSGKLTLSLRISSLEESDFGVYTCFASNRLGQDEKDMELYDFSAYLRTTTTTTTTERTTTFYLPKKTNNRQYPYHNNHHSNRNNYNNHHHNNRDYNNQIVGQSPIGGDRPQVPNREQGHQGRTQSHAPSQIYTQPYRHGNEGHYRPSKSGKGGGNGSSQMHPKCLMAVLIPLALTSFLRQPSALLLWW